MIAAIGKSFAGQDVILEGSLCLRLGEFLGAGGAGAVYALRANDFPSPAVIKILDPDSPLTSQELESCRCFRANGRFLDGIMKFTSWLGTLTLNGRKYPYYIMRRGKTLHDALSEGNIRWLRERDPQEMIRLIAYLVTGIYGLKSMGLSHHDIKPSNILLISHNGKTYPVFSDYGAVAQGDINIGTIPYSCVNTEYSTPLEKNIAYDLHCLYVTIYNIYENINLDEEPCPVLKMEKEIASILRIMRDASKKAFDRLDELMFKKHLAEKTNTPVSFYLDAVPQGNLADYFPFEEIMHWNELVILRDKNANQDKFDPMLLMKITSDRYKTVYKVLVEYNKLDTFVLPIRHYYDHDHEYVLIHAPDDKNKCVLHKKTGASKRILDSTGIPYTLEFASSREIEQKMSVFAELMNLQQIDCKFSPKDIWYMDGRWKLNLFSVDFLEFSGSDAKCSKNSFGE